MKILQLNTWTGRIKGALARFFENGDFDVVCLQEAVWGSNKLLDNFSVTVDQIKELGEFNYDFRSANWGLRISDFKMEQGNAILTREKIVEEKTEIVHGEYQELKNLEDIEKQGYTIQIVRLENGLNIVNHHGFWRPSPVGDEVTVKVMKKVAEIVRGLEGPIVMCGDLNITHDSLAMRELDFLRDLTAESKIHTTLSGLKFDGEVACDHVLVSPEIEVKNFRVLDDLVSDHKGLVLEI
ncbi:endonuclease/exonuclease/phosphatase family protein [Candidatus Saccharibacteria bacterium]|nr:endonuclease/exonuclease/phosphatase family protein [Candidatus Saccharibacteria bacterium]